MSTCEQCGCMNIAGSLDFCPQCREEREMPKSTAGGASNGYEREITEPEQEQEEVVEAEAEEPEPEPGTSPEPEPEAPAAPVAPPARPAGPHLVPRSAVPATAVVSDGPTEE